MKKIKLPKPFGHLVEKYKHLLRLDENYQIEQAYVDDEYALKNGLKSLRKLLGLTANDTCADIYAILTSNGRKVAILWEDKGSRGKGNHHQTAIKQIEITYKRLKERINNLPDEIYVAVVDVKLHKSFIQAKQFQEKRAKILVGPNNKALKVRGEQEIYYLER